MKNNLKSILLLVITFCSGTNLYSQETNLDFVTKELKQITELEIEAFKSGDCEKAVSFMDDNITFYGNGKKVPSKKVFKGFCIKLERPFEKPSSMDTQFFPLSENSAYVIRTMEFSKNDKIHKKEIVTKIWKKGSDGWKIMHLHSTIKKVDE